MRKKLTARLKPTSPGLLCGVSVRRDKPGLGFEKAAGIIRKAAAAALTAEGVAEPCEICVLLTDDDGIRALNRDFRYIDSATDVLSFPQNNFTPGEFSAAGAERNPGTGGIVLGDVAVNLRRCGAQAEEYGQTFERELSYLTIHSVLHLLGYDHLDEGAQKRLMRQREELIIKTLGENE